MRHFFNSTGRAAAQQVPTLCSETEDNCALQPLRR